MSKRKKPSDGSNKRPPSRENTRYVAIPLELHNALERYCQAHSEPEEKPKSLSWGARRALRKFLKEEGFWPH